MPSWIGPWEIAIVLVIALLIFGPKKLPDLGQSLGKSIRGFKQGMKESQDELAQAVAEVKETTSTSAAPGAKSETGAEATVGEAVPTAVTTDLPKCWSTWEEGHEACVQCTVAAKCADAGRGTSGDV
jgi:sec-independent protein translocase protein TatA